MREFIFGPCPASRVRVPITAAVTACLLFMSTATAPAQESARSSPPSPARMTAGVKSTTRPAVRPAEPAPSTAAPLSQPPASPAPSSQPSMPGGVYSEIGESPIRRDVNRNDPPRTVAGSTTPAANAPGFGIPRVAGALAVVLALIFALRWLLRRSMNAASLPGATNAVQVLSRSPLSPRQQLLLLRVGRRLLVVSDCNGQLSSLSEISDPDEVAALVGQLRDEKRVSPSGSFGNLLGMWRRGGEDEGRDEDDVEAVDAAPAEEFPRAAPDVADRGGRDRYGYDERADPSARSTREEIHGLMERVRLISNQFKE